MKIYLVGGAVRDHLLGLPVKERDYVVVGATTDEMLDQGFRQVGKEFPVFLHPKSSEEYALARMERKVKPGYQGFNFDASANVTLEEDLKRRDLTINAMAETPEGELIDPYHGKSDLDNKILRHVSDAFVEDPVRILRIGRFLARYYHLGFKVADETIELMRNMVKSGEVNALVAERVWKELERALGESNPEKFFAVLNQCGALSTLFPHLNIDGPGIHALIAAAELTQDTTVRFAALLHAMPEENIDDNIYAKIAVANICNRYRVPNAYRELALLIALNFKEAFRAQELSVDELLHFFSVLDIYRREDRFQKFLIACQAIAKINAVIFDSVWLHEAATITKSVNSKALLTQGLEGAEFAKALKEERKKMLEKWMG